MESKKTESDSKPRHDQEYGEPGFVFTDYDRGARNQNSDRDSKDERDSANEDN